MPNLLGNAPAIAGVGPTTVPIAPPAIAPVSVPGTVHRYRLRDLDADLARLADARISIYRSLAECEVVWRRAVAAGACFAFQCFEWQAAFQATIGAAEGVEPYIVDIADRNGRSLLLLPLCLERQGRLRAIAFLGGAVTDYGAPVIDPEFAASVLPGEIERLLATVLNLLPPADFVWLRRMPQAIENVRNPLAELPQARHTENGHALSLPGTADGFRASPNNRRKRRQLAKLGAVEFRSPPPDSPEAAAILPVLAAQKSRRWIETVNWDMFAKPGYRAFYDVLSGAALQSGEVHVSALTVGETIVAAHWGIVFRGRYYFLLVGRQDGEWGRYSPGRLLIEDLIGWCLARGGVGVFDLTAGEEGYKREWTDHSLPLFEYLAPRSAAGMLFIAQYRARQWLKQNRRLRNWVRRLKGKHAK